MSAAVGWEKLEKIANLPTRGTPRARARLEQRRDSPSPARLLLHIRKDIVNAVSGGNVRKFDVYLNKDERAVRLVASEDGLIIAAATSGKDKFSFRLGRIDWLPATPTPFEVCEVRVVDHGGGTNTTAIEVALPAFGEPARSGRPQEKTVPAKKTEPPAEKKSQYRRCLSGKCRFVDYTEEMGPALRCPRCGNETEPADDMGFKAHAEAPVAKPPRPPEPKRPPPTPERPVAPAVAPVAPPRPMFAGNPDLVPPTARFTGHSGIEVDVLNNAVELDRQRAILTPRGVRLVAALAVAKHGDIIPRDFVARKIWSRPPPSYDTVLSQLVPEINFALAKIGLAVRVVPRVGLTVDCV